MGPFCPGTARINIGSLPVFFVVVHCVHSVFFIRTSNFGSEAECSFFFLRFEADNVLKMFLNYMVSTTCISVNQSERDEETYQSVLSVDICYQELLIMTNRDVCHRC